MRIKEVPFNSKEYYKLCKLREEELRIPLGLRLSKEDVSNENEHHHFGSFEEEEALACLILVPIQNNRLKMRQVCTLSSHQGKGIGAKMLEFAENWAKKNNYNFMQCNARENAAPFYLKFGYEIKGDLFEEIGIPHYLMEKKISY